MFNVAKEAIFTRTVTVRVPDGYGVREESLKATYRVLPTDEAEKYDLNTSEGSAALLRRALVRLDDCVDDNGPVEYSDLLRDQVLRLPYARAAIALCYFREAQGAKEGN